MPNFALIGYGNRGMTYAAILKEMGERVVAVCDGNEGVAKQLLRVLEKKNRKNRDGKPLFQKNYKKQLNSLYKFTK